MGCFEILQYIIHLKIFFFFLIVFYQTHKATIIETIYLFLLKPLEC